jgi:hypothetical protein
MTIRGCLISFQQVIFILGNGEHTEQGRISEHGSTSLTDRTKNNKIQSPPLTRGGLGWGQAIVDTLIMT